MHANEPLHPLVVTRRHFLSGASLRLGGLPPGNLLPHRAGVVDELCFIKSMYTEAINHDPAITFFQTGAEVAGRPSLGSWVSYGLGSMSENLPAFVVLVTKGKGDQPLYARLWSN